MEQVGANVFVETVYPGVNVGCVVTDEGAVCIDTPLLSGEAQRWRALIRSLGAETVRFVVYTSGQREHVLGTQYLIETDVDVDIEDSQGRAPAGGQDIVDHLLHGPARTPTSQPPQPFPQRGKEERSAVLAHKEAWSQVQEHSTDSFKQSMVDMLADRDPGIVDLEVIPPQITLDVSLDLCIADETITLIAAAPGMLWAWLPKSQVLFTGDIVVVGTHPPLEATDTRAWLFALARIRRERRFKEAMIVPGRGPLCDVKATRAVTKYLRIARDRTRRIYRAGRSKADLNQVAADLLPLYPVADGHHERVQRQIKMALDGLYDQFKAADAAKANDGR